MPKFAFHWLEMRRFGMRNVMAECAQHTFPWWDPGNLAAQRACQVQRRHETGGDIPHVTFHARNLPSEEQICSPTKRHSRP